jgi:hypothetical protein
VSEVACKALDTVLALVNKLQQQVLNKVCGSGMCAVAAAM